MEALRVENLTKSFGGVRAIDNISFKVGKSERLAIIGPNGAGKTTLLKMLAGEFNVSDGRIFLFDKDITKSPEYKRVHNGMALSFQITSLFNDLSVLENLLLAIQSKESFRNNLFRPITSYAGLYEKAEKLLESMDMLKKKDESISSISHGEQRKLEIALSLASEPELLMLDEPNCGLTSTESKEISRLINRLGSEVTIILVAHDMDLVFDVADRIICLHYGRVIAEGTGKEIRGNQKVKEIYIGQGGDVGNA